MRSNPLRAAALGLSILMLAGCGGKRTPETMIKDRIDLVNALAAEYERQSAPLDPGALAESTGRMTKINGDLKDLEEELNKLTGPDYFAALAKNHVENKKANGRLRWAQDVKNGIKR